MRDLGRMARIAGAAYEGVWVPIPGLKLLNTYEGRWTGARVYFVEDERRRYVAWAGTEPSDIRDWWINLSAGPAKFLSFPGTYHEGFIRSLNSVREDVERDVMSANLREAKPLVCLGHSLGGPQAEICHAHLRILGLDVSSVTFGAPGYTDKRARSWLRKFSGTMVRVQNAGDPVPYLAKIKGWYHVSDSLFLDPNGGVHHHTSVWQRLKYLRMAWTGDEDRIWKQILDCHKWEEHARKLDMA